MPVELMILVIYTRLIWMLSKKLKAASWPYEIFFTISKSSKKKKSLRLYVQSAYVPTDRGKRRKKPIRFAILAYKTRRNEVVRIPK